MMFDIPFLADWNKIGDYRQSQTDRNTLQTLEMQAHNQNQGSKLKTHSRHLPIAFPSPDQALSRHSDQFLMMPLRKPPEFEGFPLFATGTRKVFS
jgi:hypothetical protein